MEEEAWQDISRKKWSTKYVLGYIIDGTYVEVYKRQNFALESTFKIEFESHDSGQSRRHGSCIEG
jgi:hypothetical protein